MSKLRELLALPAGSVVGDYRLERVQTTWGFCLVYQAVDVLSGKPVAVHELLPEELVTRSEGGAVIGRSRDAEEKLAWATERFLREGRGLAEYGHPALQKLIAAFEANGTAYWVTPRDEARNLKTWLQLLGRPPTESELQRLLAPLLGGLERAHGAGLFHLNLKPETIQITAEGKPRLTRFSGARQAIARYGHEAGAVTAGYSPPEQYQVEKAEGPWTDIYSLAAVLHRAISGQAPLEANQRLARDTYQPLLARYSASYGHDFLSAIDAALAVDSEDRPQSIAGWRAMLGTGPARRGTELSPGLVLIGAVGAIFLLAFGVWFVLPKPPRPDELEKHKLAMNEARKEPSAEDKDKSKEQEETTKAEAEVKAAEEQKKREEAQKEKERQLAEEKSDPAKMAADKDAAARAEAEKLAAERAAQLAMEAAEAAAQAEAAKRAAEEAVRMASADDPAKKAAAERAAAEAAAEAARMKAEAEKAARIAEEARKAEEKTAQALKATEAEMAKRMAAAEEAKRQASEMAAQQARAEAEKRAQEQKMAPDKDAAEKAAAEKLSAEQIAALKAAAEKAAMERMAAEKAAAEQAAARAAAEKMAAEKAAAEDARRMAAEKAAAEMAAAQKKAAEQAAAEKAAAEKAQAEKVQAEKMAAEKAAAEKMAANQKGDPNQGKYKKTGVEGAAEDETKPTNNKGGGFSAISGIPGVWETTATDPDGKPKRRLTIYDDGRYLISDNHNWQDAGAILASAGRIQMRSDVTGDVVRSSFKLRTLSKIVTAGALGDEEWTRVSRSPGNDPNKPKP